MHNYRTIAPITLHSGVIGLSAAQAAPRAHCLAAGGRAGVYQITSPVQFCAGEVIGLVPENIQAIARSVVELDAGMDDTAAAVQAAPQAAEGQSAVQDGAAAKAAAGKAKAPSKRAGKPAARKGKAA